MASTVTQLHNSEDANAKEWALMLASPQTHMVRAPSTTPFLASRTRFVRSIDIPYAQTNVGAFSVAQFPNPLAALGVTGVPIAIPGVYAPIVLTSPGPSKATKSTDSASYIDRGIVAIYDANAAVLGTTNFRDLGDVDLGYSGIPGLRLVQPAGSVFNASFKIKGYEAWKLSMRMRAARFTIATGIWDFVDFAIVQNIGGIMQWTNITVAPGTLYGGLFFQFMAQAGTPINLPDIELGGHVIVTSTGANVATGVDSQSFALTTSQLVSAGKVGLQRCTAMSLLVTNMAAPLVSGGELVMARCNFKQLEEPGGTQGLMDSIKRLPEEKYWRSGNIKDGGYVWWLPDELSSYEPMEMTNTPPTENVNVASGVMSDPAGFVRVIATWVFEFYTPVQLFDRDYNCTYSDAHKDVFTLLCQKDACSANAGHVALIAGLASLAAGVYNFYQKHQKVLDPLAARAVKQARKVAFGQARNDLAKVIAKDAAAGTIGFSKERKKAARRVNKVSGGPPPPPRKRK